jgi:hypothetical protein
LKKHVVGNSTNERILAGHEFGVSLSSSVNVTIAKWYLSLPYTNGFA